MPRHDAPGRDEGEDGLGVRLIVGYKLTKAVAALSLGVLFLLLGKAGLAQGLLAVASILRHHAVEAWSIELSAWLVRAASGRHLEVVSFALLLDGVSSLVEGWALHRRYRWSQWLIVGATACILPFEVAALVRRVSPARIALLFVNALIVAYLVRRGIAAARDPRRQQG